MTPSPESIKLANSCCEQATGEVPPLVLNKIIENAALALDAARTDERKACAMISRGIAENNLDNMEGENMPEFAVYERAAAVALEIEGLILARSPGGDRSMEDARSEVSPPPSVDF